MLGRRPGPPLTEADKRCGYDQCPRPDRSWHFYRISDRTASGGRDWSSLIGKVLCAECYSRFGRTGSLVYKRSARRQGRGIESTQLPRKSRGKETAQSFRGQDREGGGEEDDSESECSDSAVSARDEGGEGTGNMLSKSLRRGGGDGDDRGGSSDDDDEKEQFDMQHVEGMLHVHSTFWCGRLQNTHIHIIHTCIIRIAIGTLFLFHIYNLLCV